MSFSIIVAIGENNEIGLNNDLLWHIPGDLKRFKAITTGHAVIMGKRTYESLPKRPLPNRRNIVLSDDCNDCFPGAETVGSIEQLVSMCEHDEENFVIGGGMVYKQFLPMADKLYLTLVHRSFEADVFFPCIDMDEWDVLEEESHRDSEPPFTYQILTKKK